MTQYNIPNGTWIHLKGNLTLLGFLTAKRAAYIDVIHVQLCGILIVCMADISSTLDLMRGSTGGLTRATLWLSGDWQHPLITTIGSSAHRDLWPPRGGRKHKREPPFEALKISPKSPLFRSPFTQMQLKVKLLPTVTHYRVPCVCLWVWDRV